MKEAGISPYLCSVPASVAELGGRCVAEKVVSWRILKLKRTRKIERKKECIGDRTELIYLFLSNIGNRPSEMKRKCLSLGIWLRLAN